jgi:hypothetical protein
VAGSALKKQSFVGETVNCAQPGDFGDGRKRKNVKFVKSALQEFQKFG